MELLLTKAVALLIIAVLVALAARWLKLPYTVGLVGVGIALASTQSANHITLTRNFVFEFILPPLLFEAAINIHWRELRQDLPAILTLAIPGTAIAAAAIAWGLHFTLNWPLKSAAVFGILIAATDPVAVIAMFKDNGITGRLRLLTESESLFNDGVAAVLFTLALGWAQSPSGGISPIPAAATLVFTAGGGMFLGALCAGAALAVAGRTADHLVEGTITLAIAYGAFQLAEYFGCSGVLATITAGLLIGNFGVLAEENRSMLSTQGREFALALWEFIAFLANSTVFLLIGITTARIPFSELGLTALLTIIALVLLSRALSVYPLCLLFQKSARRISLAEQHVLWWGGLRGALGLALAMSLPDSLRFHNQILIATFGVVAFSVIVQGITMPILLKQLGFIPATPSSPAQAGDPRVP
jgi:CPA1 family monovalent cation:H+ antiporter